MDFSNSNHKIAVFCLGIRASAVAQNIADALDAEVHGKKYRVPEADVFFTDAKAHLESLFADGKAIVGVCSSAVLIRAVAPCLRNKRHEPPVVAVAEDGSVAVPLLGGHHGANDLARAIAEELHGIAAVTTAGDIRFGIALDEPPQGLSLGNPEEVKAFTSSLLAGESVFLQAEKPVFSEWLLKSRLPFSPDGQLKISVTHQSVSGDARHLVYHPKTLAVGVGCERGTAPAELRNLVRNSLDVYGIDPQSVAVIVSIYVKKDEAALHSLAEHMGCPVRFFNAQALETQADKLQNPSDIVFQEVGCHGVAEGAALAAVGKDGMLLVPKQKSTRATCAIGKSPALLHPQKIGQAPGALFLVGTGPGCPEWRLAQSETMLREATDWVGYGLYLDLIADLRRDQKCHRFDMGREEERVRHALALAEQGRIVALVSSGDPGIYAMATLVFELQERGEPDWKRIEVQISPGISAFQAAAARIGAPLGHDFCAISLSDLLTPWETIKRRVRTAAEGDFVIAFYNPVSQRRTTQLAEARDILLQHRVPQTPVVLGRNLGREGETVKTVSLRDLTPDKADMLTVVIVGSSQTRRLNLPNGEVRVYTPRGYSEKAETT